MKSLVTLTLLLLTFTSSASADFEAGRAAANRGDFATALREWQPLSDSGNKDAQFALGRMYARGDGVLKDFSKARELFSSAATQGHARAAYSLGLMYEFGDGVTKDLPVAKLWFKRAEAAGEREAGMHLKNLAQIPDITAEGERNAVTAAPGAPAVPSSPVLQSDNPEIILPTSECPIQAVQDSGIPKWIGDLTPGDSVRDVYCKLTAIDGITEISGFDPEGKLSTPFDRTLAGANSASLKLGFPKELVPKGSPKNLDPKKIVRLSITSPQIKVAKFSIAGLSFKGALWFEGSAQRGLNAALGNEAALKISKDGKEIIFPSKLVSLELFANGVEVSQFGDAVVQALKEQHPTAKIKERSATSMTIAFRDPQTESPSSSNQPQGTEAGVTK